MVNYANRGRSLEELISHANDYYRLKGLGMMVKVPTEFLPLRNSRGAVHGVKVTHKATVDFIGRWFGRPIAVEAKATSTGAIRLDAVKLNQAQDLTDWSFGGYGYGLVVVSFGYERFFAVPWQAWSEAHYVRVIKGERRSNLIIEHGGVKWTVPKKVSLTADEIPSEWEVFMAPWGLDYMGV